MRRFWIQNDKGERKNLTDYNGIILKKPSGLGITMSCSFADLDDGFFALSKSSGKQPTIAGDLLFMNGYSDYRAFVNWLAAANSLTLIYNPYGSAEFYIDVSVNYITKGELERAGVLITPFSLYALSPWYSPLNLKITMRKSETVSMRYSYRYDADLRYGARASNYTANIPAGGHLPSALHISYTGELTNPRIIITGLSSGKQYGECEIGADIADGEALEFSSQQNNGYVKKITASGEDDLTQFIDPNTDPFIRFPINEDCSLAIYSDNDLMNELSATIYRYYRSV